MIGRMDTPREMLPPPQLIAWLGGSPALTGDGDRLLALLDDVLTLARPYGVDSVWSSEPRTYRLTPRGRDALRQSLAAGRPESLIVASDPRVRTTGVIADLTLGSREFPGTARQVSVRLTPPTSWDATATQLVEFVQRWFAPLGAAAAFVSAFRFGDAAAQDDPSVTAHERGPDRHALWTVWPALPRYLRGVFWGNGLGAGLCARLGGPERSLADAPVALARRLGDGVWLQLPGAPPAAREDLARLGDYLTPLLHWTKADVAPLAPPQPPTPSRQRPAAGAPPAGGSSRSAQGRAVMVRLAGELGPDVALNVTLAASPTDEQRAAIETAVNAWYHAGFEGAFPSAIGQGVFHDLIGPSSDGTVLRWQADLGSADVERAIRVLAERLGAVPGVPVRRLVVGTEDVG